MHKMTLKTLQRFLQKFDNPCWLWKDKLSADGYGYFFIRKKQYRAHRVAWEVHFGQAIPPGMDVQHRCNNFSCVNPAHLFLAPAAGLQVRETRKRGSKGKKLDSQKASEIRTKAGQGMSHKELARRYNVTERTISHVVSKATWKDN